MNPDALALAKAADARAEGKSLGPLDGVPVVVKDAMDMVGFPTTGGWQLLHSKTAASIFFPRPTRRSWRACGRPAP